MLNDSFDSTDNQQRDKFENDLYDACEAEVLEEETFEAMTEMFSSNEFTLFDEILAATQDQKNKGQHQLNIKTISNNIERLESNLKSIDFITLEMNLNQAENTLLEIDSLRVFLEKTDGNTSAREYEACNCPPNFDFYLSTSEYYYLTSPGIIAPQTQFSPVNIQPIYFDENLSSFNRQVLCSIEELDETIVEDISINDSISLETVSHTVEGDENINEASNILEVCYTGVCNDENNAVVSEILQKDKTNLNALNDSSLKRMESTEDLSMISKEEEKSYNLQIIEETNKKLIELNLESETVPRLPDVVTTSLSENDNNQKDEIRVVSARNLNQVIEELTAKNKSIVVENIISTRESQLFKDNSQDAHKVFSDCQEIGMKANKCTNLHAISQEASVYSSDTTLYVSAINDTALVQSENSFCNNDKDKQHIFADNLKSAIVSFKDSKHVVEFLQSTDHIFEVIPPKCFKNKSVQVSLEKSQSEVESLKGHQSPQNNTATLCTQSPSEENFTKCFFKHSVDRSHFNNYRTSAHNGLNVPTQMPKLWHFNRVDDTLNAFLCCNKSSSLSNISQKSSAHLNSDFNHHPSKITCCHCTHSNLNLTAI